MEWTGKRGTKSLVPDDLEDEERARTWVGYVGAFGA
jgi:hypothetical protein